MPPKDWKRSTEGDDIETIEAEEAGESLLGRAKRAFRGETPKEPKAPKASAPPRGHPSKDEVGELVQLVNIPVALMSPRDALTPWESAKLTDALSTYAQTSESARRVMYAIVKRSALLTLANVAFLIALPRMIRHGILPPGIAPYLAGVCDPTQLVDAANMQQQQDGSWVFVAPQGSNGTHPDYSRPADIPPTPAAAVGA